MTTNHLSRRVAITGMCAAVAVPVAVRAASPSVDAELIALGKQFDVAAAGLAREQRRNSEAHAEAERMTPVPECLMPAPSDIDIGIPFPRSVDKNYCYDLNVTAARKIDHPRARQIVAAYKKWHAEHKAALEFCGYDDDHPDLLDAYDALKPIEDAICRLPAHTLAGLQVKGRVVFNSAVGLIGDDSDEGGLRVSNSIIRDLMRMQGIAGIETDHDFVKQDPFGKLAAQS